MSRCKLAFQGWAYVRLLPGSSTQRSHSCLCPRVTRGGRVPADPAPRSMLEAPALPSKAGVGVWGCSRTGRERPVASWPPLGSVISPGGPRWGKVRGAPGYSPLWWGLGEKAARADGGACLDLQGQTAGGGRRDCWG